MLERVNSNLDTLAGIRKNADQIIVETEIKTTPTAKKQEAPRHSGSWNENRKILTAHSRTAT